MVENMQFAFPQFPQSRLGGFSLDTFRNSKLASLGARRQPYGQVTAFGVADRLDDDPENFTPIECAWPSFKLAGVLYMNT